MRARGTSSAQDRYARELSRLGSDNVHGARELGLRGLRSLARAADTWAKLAPSARRSAARAAVTLLGTVQPAMGPFRSWSAELTALLRARPGRGPASEVRRWVRSKQGDLRAEPRRIETLVRRLLPPGATLVTFSRSDTVVGALRRLPRARRPRHVLALESLPGGEGRSVARELARAGIPSRVIHDRAARQAVRQADLVVVGADAVEANGSLVNKVGTHRLALLARQAGIPLIVVAGRSKWVGRPLRRRRLPDLFDRTPGGLVTEYWTDQGAVRGGRASRRAQGRAHR